MFLLEVTLPGVSSPTTQTAGQALQSNIPAIVIGALMTLVSGGALWKGVGATGRILPYLRWAGVVLGPLIAASGFMPASGNNNTALPPLLTVAPTNPITNMDLHPDDVPPVEPPRARRSFFDWLFGESKDIDSLDEVLSGNRTGNGIIVQLAPFLDSSDYSVRKKAAAEIIKNGYGEHGSASAASSANGCLEGKLDDSAIIEGVLEGLTELRVCPEAKPYLQVLNNMLHKAGERVDFGRDLGTKVGASRASHSHTKLEVTFDSEGKLVADIDDDEGIPRFGEEELEIEELEGSASEVDSDSEFELSLESDPEIDISGSSSSGSEFEMDLRSKVDRLRDDNEAVLRNSSATKKERYDAAKILLTEVVDNKDIWDEETLINFVCNHIDKPGVADGIFSALEERVENKDDPCYHSQLTEKIFEILEDLPSIKANDGYSEKLEELKSSFNGEEVSEDRDIFNEDDFEKIPSLDSDSGEFELDLDGEDDNRVSGSDSDFDLDTLEAKRDSINKDFKQWGYSAKVVNGEIIIEKGKDKYTFSHIDDEGDLLVVDQRSGYECFILKKDGKVVSPV